MQYTLKQIEQIENYLMKYDLASKDFYYNFINLERYLDFEGIDKELFTYHFPLHKECSVTAEINFRHLALKICINGETYYLGKDEKSLKEFSDNANKITNIFRKNRLIFAPKVTDDFMNCILNVQKDQIVDLNTRMTLVCLESDEEKVILKTQYEGNYADLSIDSFNSEELYILNKKNPFDDNMQYLYGKAFQKSSNTAEIRVRFSTRDGWDIVQDIENKLKNGDIAIKNIGKIQLKVIKSDGMCRWYDNDGTLLQKDKIATMFSWVKNSTAEIHILKHDGKINEFSEYVDEEMINRSYIEQIRILANEQKLNELISKSHEFSSFFSNASISFSGFKTDNNHNYNTCTYVFKNNSLNNKKSIYKITYFDNDFSLNNISSIGEVEKDEFEQFCKDRFAYGFKMFKIKKEELIQSYMKNYPYLNRQQIEEYLNKINYDYNNFNSLDIDKTTVNNIDSKLNDLIDSMISNNNEINITDIINEDYNERY